MENTAPAEGLEERIRAILSEKLFMDASESALGSRDSLIVQHGVDSVRLFDLVVGLEGEFGIAFDDDELALRYFDTVSDIIEKVAAKMGEK